MAEGASRHAPAIHHRNAAPRISRNRRVRADPYITSRITTYEYRILKTNAPAVTEEQLNEFGSEGWQLQCILPWSDMFYYYFIRKIRQN